MCDYVDSVHRFRQNIRRYYLNDSLLFIELCENIMIHSELFNGIVLVCLLIICCGRTSLSNKRIVLPASYKPSPEKKYDSFDNKNDSPDNKIDSSEKNKGLKDAGKVSTDNCLTEKTPVSSTSPTISNKTAADSNNTSVDGDGEQNTKLKPNKTAKEVKSDACVGEYCFRNLIDLVALNVLSIVLGFLFVVLILFHVLVHILMKREKTLRKFKPPNEVSSDYSLLNETKIKTKKEKKKLSLKDKNNTKASKQKYVKSQPLLTPGPRKQKDSADDNRRKSSTHSKKNKFFETKV